MENRDRERERERESKNERERVALCGLLFLHCGFEVG